jgi:hypothetical protein
VDDGGVVVVEVGRDDHSPRVDGVVVKGPTLFVDVLRRENGELVRGVGVGHDVEYALLEGLVVFDHALTPSRRMDRSCLSFR